MHSLISNLRRNRSFAFYLAFLVAIFVCSAAASVVYVDRQSARDARRQAHGEAEFAARAAAKRVGSDLELLRATVGQLAANPSVVGAVVHPAGCTLTFGAPGDSGGGHVDIIRPDGVAVCSSRPRAKNGTLRGYVREPWVRAALRSAILRAPALDTAVGRQAAIFAAPASGKAVVAGFLDLGSLGASLRSIYGGNRSAEFLITTGDSQRVVARSTAAKRWIGTSVRHTAFARSTETDRAGLDGVHRIYASAPVPGTAWRLYVGENRDRALAAGTRLRNREIVILLASLSVILLATIFVYRRMVVPMKQLAAGVKSTAAHHHARPVAVSGPAEVRELATEINALIASVNTHEAVRRAKEEAERANEAKSRFLSHMSHELRTPLAAIMGFAEMLHRGASDETQREWTRRVLDGGRHLLEIVNDLLEISRIEAGKVVLAITPVDVRRAVDDVLALVEPLAAERGILIERRAGRPSSQAALADPLRLKQVLLNLVSNAIKYNRESGSVTVSVAETDEKTVRVEVADTGQGIHPDLLERLFDPFERLGAEYGSIGGTGLGLVVTRGLVEAMDGRLEVSSELGTGTSFTLELPLEAEPSDRLETAAPQMPAAAPATAGSVLYIDDNPMNLRLVESVLSGLRPGIELRTATAGTAGAALAEDRPPDLLLLDLNLPDISGEEVLRRVRARPQTVDVPVIVLSADSTSRNVTRLLQSGADAYVTKPFEVPQFLDVVDRLLRTR